jgi:hypothetical protein
MIQILISICLSLFFLGVARLITQNWVVAIPVAFFVLLFSFFGLCLTTAPSIGDDKETMMEEVKVLKVNARSAPRLAGFTEPIYHPASEKRNRQT